MAQAIKLILGALLGWSCWAGAPPVVDPRGTWEGVYDDPAAIELMKMTIRRDGSSWKASVETIFSATGKSEQDSACQLTITGDRVSFAAQWHRYDYLFRGRIEDNIMEGTFDLSRRGEIQSSGTWRVRRATAELEHGDARDPHQGATDAFQTREEAMRTPGNELPRPTGALTVGRTPFYWTDPSRLEVCTDDPWDHRRLKVTLWYPAQIKGRQAPAPYFRDFERLREVEATMVPDFSPSISTHAFEQPQVSESGPFAVLVFSHGLGSNSDSYTSIFTDLASHGYVVAAIDHTFDNRGTVFPGGKLVTIDDRWSTALYASKIERERFTIARLEVMAEDADFVRRKLEELNQEPSGKFSGKLDLSKLGILGHSLGGAAVALACQKFNAFKACINMDGMPTGEPFLPDSNGNGPEQPFLFLAKRFPLKGALLARSGLTRSEFEALDASRRRRVYHLESAMPNGFVLSIDNAQHISFSDFPLLMSDPAPQYRNRYRVLQRVRIAIRSFFGKYLLNQKTPLFDGQAPADPELTLDRYVQRSNR